MFECLFIFLEVEVELKMLFPKVNHSFFLSD